MSRMCPACHPAFGHGMYCSAHRSLTQPYFGSILDEQCIDRQPPGLESSLIHYCVVRADLTVGQQAAQLLHASGESFAMSKTLWEENIIGVALNAKDETHLRELSDKLHAAGIQFHGIVEQDSPYTGQLMSIGLYPTRDRDAVRKVLSSLPLIK